MRPVRTAARTMLAALFVIQGWAAVRDPAKLAERARPVTDRLEPTLRRLHPSLPTDAETLVRLNGAAQVTSGVLLATGHATRPAALVLAGSLVPTTLAGHPFWTYDDPAQRSQQRINFLKNLGLLGGLLFAALDREGRPGPAWRARHAVHSAQRDARIAILAAKAGRRLPRGS